MALHLVSTHFILLFVLPSCYIFALINNYFPWKQVLISFLAVLNAQHSFGNVSICLFFNICENFYFATFQCYLKKPFQLYFSNEEKIHTSKNRLPSRRILFSYKTKKSETLYTFVFFLFVLFSVISIDYLFFCCGKLSCIFKLLFLAKFS